MGGGTVTVSIDTSIVRDLVTMVESIIDKVTVVVGEDGVSVQSIDPTHVAMISLNVGRDAFLDWSPRTGSYTLPVAKIKEIVKLAGAGDVLDIESDGAQVTFTLGRIKRKTTLLADSTAKIRIPSFDTPCTAILPSDALKLGLKATKGLSDGIRFTMDASGLTITSAGDSDESEFRIPADEIPVYEHGEDVSSAFTEEYIAKVVKSLPKGCDVSIMLGEDKPIRITTEFSGTESTVMIAPRVEGE